MSVVNYTAPNGAVINYIGQADDLQETNLSTPSKDEWGMDTLTQQIRGSIPAFLGVTPVQGNTYTYGAATFYLQTWQPIDHPVFPGYSLIYKGLIGGDLPDPLISSQRVEMLSTVTADGLSISYGGGTIISGAKEVKYETDQTVYRYITSSEPSAPTYTASIGPGIIIKDSRITASWEDADGNISTITFTGNAPAGLVTALTATPSDVVSGPNWETVVGSPYYECVDVVRLEYPV